MQKFKARWIAIATALVLLCSFGLAACDSEGSDTELGALRDIFIVTSELKTTYEVGDTFDYSAVKIRAVYEGGEEKLTAADADKGVTHTDLDMQKAGTQTLTVSYKEKSASIGITVREKQQDVLKGLQFTGGKTAYVVGETVDYHAFELTAIYSVGSDVKLYGDSEEVTAQPATVSTAEAGTTKVTFSYTDGVTKSVSVDIIVSDAPVPVTLISIEVQSTAAARTVAFGATLDAKFLGQFTLVCHYSDGTTNETTLKGNSAGVTTNVSAISTSVAGEKELTFTYEGKSVTVPITVLEQVQKQTLSRFRLPKFYMDVAAIEDDPDGTASTDRDSFMKGFETYKVGDDNAFEFQPDATALNSNQAAIPITVRTTFTLEKKGASGEFEPVSNPETYVTTEPLLPNYYYFTEAAEGSVFKLTVVPDEAYYNFSSAITDDADKKIEAILEVVDGYNVYNQIGLSVFDNLNVKHWAEVKEAAGTLRWDSKPLADYNIIKEGDPKYAPVSNIVLHGDITIDPDALPDSYFWKDTDEGYSTVETNLKQGANIPDSVKNYLAGSLKDGLASGYYKFDDSTSGDLEEEAKTSVNMQKALYVSTGTGIEGNFHEITYHTSGAKHSLYTVYDGKSKTGSAFPLSHWSIFKYGKATTAGVDIVNEGKPHISDLRILGQSPRVAATQGEPAHLMAFNTCTNEVNLENTIVSRLFVVVLGDKVSTAADSDDTEVAAGVNVSDSKFFDIYSNMFYLWRAIVNVKNSIMEDAGGPVFILCDGTRKEATGTAGEPRLIVDKASRFKSEAAGTESWYKLNDAGTLFGYVKNIDTLAKAKLGVSLCSSTAGENELVNVIAIVIPEPADIMKPAKDASNVIKTRGRIERIEGDSTEHFYGGYATNMLASGLMLKLCPLLSGADEKIEAGMDILHSAVYNTDPLNFSPTNSAITDTEEMNRQVKEAWQAAVAASDWYMLNFNAGAQASSQLYPWFGILIGGVHAVS